MIWFESAASGKNVDRCECDFRCVCVRFLFHVLCVSRLIAKLNLFAHQIMCTVRHDACMYLHSTQRAAKHKKEAKSMAEA